jgi:predicted nucleic acid-binding protein
MKYGSLLDTNVISELRKPKPHGAVVAWLRSIPGEQVFISAITLGEIQAGIEVTRERDSVKATEIEDWLDEVAASYQILPADGRVIREWARLMHGRSERLIEDAILAATARIHGLTLVTRNTRDFKDFKVPVLNPWL